MNEKEREFEMRLYSLVLLKALLVARGEFHGKEAEEFEQMWDAAFEVLN